jgi:hypothetical protein
MTTDVLKLPGNYKVATLPGGSITLDVGGTSTNGTVVIDGNLTVLGVQTIINSTNASITDNIIILNSGETNNNPEGEVTLGSSGFMVARGFSDATTSAAFLLYDDTFNKSGLELPEIGLQGIWKFGSDNKYGQMIQVQGILTDPTFTELGFLGSYNKNAVLSVKGTSNYVDNVVDDDHIPNKAYVDRVLNSTEIAQKLQVGDSFIEINDPAVSTSSKYYSSVPIIKAALGTSTNIAFTLQGSDARFASLTLSGNRIQVNTGTTATIILDPSANGTIQMNGNFRFQQSPPLASTASYTGIYSTSTVGGGGTGLYFVNTNNTDELVSRRRSIVYSIIF